MLYACSTHSISTETKPRSYWNLLQSFLTARGNCLSIIINMSTILSLSGELLTEIVVHLDIESFQSFRLVCAKFELDSRFTFSNRFVTSSRLRMDQHDIDDMLLACQESSVAASVQQLQLSTFMVDPTRERALLEFEMDVRRSPGLLTATPSLCRYLTSFYGRKSDDQIVRNLVKLLKSLPRLRCIVLGPALHDIDDSRVRENTMLRTVAELSYKRWHFVGRWKIMSIQNERAIMLVLKALSLSPAVIPDLVIDRSVHGQELILQPAPQCHMSTGTCLSQLRSLDITVSADDRLDFNLSWITQLVALVSQLYHLTLRFRPSIQPETFHQFMSTISHLRLKTLAISGLGRSCHPILAYFAKENPACLLTIASTHIDLTLSEGRNIEKLQVACRIPEISPKQCWFSQELRARKDWQLELCMRAFANKLLGYSLFAASTFFQALRLDWSRVRLQIAVGTKISPQISVPLTTFTSYFGLLNTLTKLLNVGASRLQSQVHIIHVATDGASLLELVDARYVDTGCFRDRIEAADCWMDSRQHCIVLLEIHKGSCEWLPYTGSVWSWGGGL